MKKSAIRDTFNGIRGYSETIKKPKPNKERTDKLCDIENNLIKQLNSKQFKLHEEFLALIDDDCCDEIDFYFVEGFKLGLRIGIECFIDN